MILAAPTVYDQADLIGFHVQVVIVAVVLILGAISLLTWDRRHEPADTFEEDFISHPADVAKEERRRIHEGWL